MMEVSEVLALCRQMDIHCRIFNYGRQINIQDRSGEWHSYYPTTGTLVFQQEHNWSKKHTVRDLRLDESFMREYFLTPDNIKKLFNEEVRR